MYYTLYVLSLYMYCIMLVGTADLMVFYTDSEIMLVVMSGYMDVLSVSLYM